MKKQCIAALLALTACAWAQAATLVADTAADLSDPTPGDGICGTGVAGTCSLRAAIQEANALPGADTITLYSGNYELTQAPANNLLTISSDLTINGMGVSAGATAINGGGDRLVLQITGNHTVNLTNLAIIGGTGAGSAFGGGLVVGGGTATLTRVGVQGNSSASSTTKQGGGIYVHDTATLHLIDSVVTGNTAGIAGGGVMVRVGGTAHISGSTIDNNTVASPAGSGGGIGVGGTLHLVNSTISGNTAPQGSGISVTANGTADVRFVTIAANTATQPGGAQLAAVGPAQISGSIVANPTVGINCWNLTDQLQSGGNNLDSGTTCGFGAAGDIASANPLLAPLAYVNNLIAPIHALQAGSPAINAGPTSGVIPATDQRGAARVQMGRADIGAYESALGIWAGGGGGGNVQAVPVDNPFALTLTAVGLLGLALRGRRKNS
ncbi:hypothetical protein KW843_11675 [Acidovorax sp. sif1233]|uniref:choice-of-anchor Q domain-containing protein n=1 Tax=Acidovorax sp. sif1233 TaxID=2854792 RepID=UPI001C4721A2|nr:choice-of-anchor Q domain-containing protein [Acidovorax sp. sif1233]MBV7455130.1 hypothetical protein [Acidovorax sp. sif1233]